MEYWIIRRAPSGALIRYLWIDIMDKNGVVGM